MRKVDHWFGSLRRLLVPSHCPLCHAPVDDDALPCPGCLAELPWNRAACPHCAVPVPLAGQACARCAQRLAFTAAWAAFRFESPVRQAILALKYHAGFSQVRWLAAAMAEELRTSGQMLPELLLPVPLHAGRLRRRGYNQALELARTVAGRLSLPVAIAAARRRRATPDQIGLSASQRRRALRGAFSVTAQVRGRRVALLDDVMTTGATLAELARACAAAGAAEIRVWALARAELGRDGRN